MKISFSLFLLFLFYYSVAQKSSTENQLFYSILFYNVENLFDASDDPLTQDEEFTPEGSRHWTSYRMRKKAMNLSKVILGASGWDKPALIGLCEVENRRVLELLLKETPLKNINYGIIHKESPDLRGIDVAVLYNRELFLPLQYACYPLTDDAGKTRDTREILYVQGVLMSDTLHLFFNHWPSRYSGLLESKPFRKEAALLLRHLTDSLKREYLNPAVILMGDFNDQPSDESICKWLNAQKVEDLIHDDKLYNLSAEWMEENKGTLKYKSQWYLFDQVIVSGNLLQAEKRLTVLNAAIADLPFLTEKDMNYGGIKLYRTWNGYRYQGGFSDHLPVILRLQPVD